MSEKCKQTTWGVAQWGPFKERQCSFSVWKEHPEDGYCKRHHPITVEARLDKSQAAWEKKLANRPEVRLAEMTKQRDALYEALEETLSLAIAWAAYYQVVYECGGSFDPVHKGIIDKAKNALALVAKL